MEKSTTALPPQLPNKFLTAFLPEMISPLLSSKFCSLSLKFNQSQTCSPSILRIIRSIIKLREHIKSSHKTTVHPA